MLKEIYETYDYLLYCINDVPQTPIGEAFSKLCISQIIDEYSWLKEQVNFDEKENPKKFVVVIPNEINNQFLEEFLQTDLNMTFHLANLNSIVYKSDNMPVGFKDKILKKFGTCTLENLHCELRTIDE